MIDFVTLPDVHQGKQASFCVLNAQSAGNKTDVIVDYITCHAIDICAITETWLRDEDDVIKGELAPPGFSVSSHPRPGRMGGGVALIYRDTCPLSSISSGNKPSYEYLEAAFSSGPSGLRVIVFYTGHPIQALIQSLLLHFSQTSRIIWRAYYYIQNASLSSVISIFTWTWPVTVTV